MGNNRNKSPSFRKKSMAEGVFVSIVITLAVIVVLIGASALYANIIKGKTDIEICRASVLAAAKLKFLGKPPGDINCPRTEVTIEYKKDMTEYPIKDAILDEMKTCWYKMGGDSQLNPYEQNLLFGSNIICLICSEISFDEKIQQEFPRIDGFHDLFKASPEFDDSILVDNTQGSWLPDSLNPDWKYYVVHITLSSTAAKDFIGSENTISSLALVSSEKLSTLECGMVRG